MKNYTRKESSRLFGERKELVEIDKPLGSGVLGEGRGKADSVGAKALGFLNVVLKHIVTQMLREARLRRSLTAAASPRLLQLLKQFDTASLQRHFFGDSLSLRIWSTKMHTIWGFRVSRVGFYGLWAFFFWLWIIC